MHVFHVKKRVVLASVYINKINIVNEASCIDWRYRIDIRDSRLHMTR